MAQVWLKYIKLRFVRNQYICQKRKPNHFESEYSTNDSILYALWADLTQLGMTTQISLSFDRNQIYLTNEWNGNGMARRRMKTEHNGLTWKCWISFCWKPPFAISHPYAILYLIVLLAIMPCSEFANPKSMEHRLRASAAAGAATATVRKLAVCQQTCSALTIPTYFIEWHHRTVHI